MSDVTSPFVLCRDPWCRVIIMRARAQGHARCPAAAVASFRRSRCAPVPVRRRRPCQPAAAVSPEHVDAATQLWDVAVGVGLPCTVRALQALQALGTSCGTKNRRRPWG